MLTDGKFPVKQGNGTQKGESNHEHTIQTAISRFHRDACGSLWRIYH